MDRHNTLAHPPPPALLLALPLALLLAGCGGGGTNGGGSSNVGTSSPAPASAPVLSASAVLPDGLTATLFENTATVAVGGSVTYTLTLTNNTSQAISVRLGIDCSYKFGETAPASLVISNPDGVAVNQGGTGCTGGSIPITPTVVAPGQSLSSSASSGSVFSSAGRYSATSGVGDAAAPPGGNTTVGPLAVTVQ